MEVRWGGVKKPTESGKEGKQKRAQKDEMVGTRHQEKAPGEGTSFSTKDEGSGAGTFLMTSC